MSSLLFKSRVLAMLLRSHYTASLYDKLPCSYQFWSRGIEIYEPLNFNSCSNKKDVAAASGGLTY